jgi:hypothetical protein
MGMMKESGMEQQQYGPYDYTVSIITAINEILRRLAVLEDQMERINKTNA